MRVVLRDLAIRSGAFEAMFALRGDESDPIWGRVIEGMRRAMGDDLLAVDLASELRATRSSTRAYLASMRMHRDAVLAEAVVLGVAGSVTFASPIVSVDNEVAALPFARALILANSGRSSDALAVIEQILARVPGHGLALEQAVRCCDKLGLVEASAAYTKRSSRLGRASGATPGPKQGSSLRSRTVRVAAPLVRRDARPW